nr:cordon-bleu protein-like 1 isoform X4 [Danio rerio]|eukprot:XP_021332692.1 cordon-bleu protein-like 1 isoform X4 [Danio rerio]
MDAQEDLLSQDITLTVLIPGGQETTATVHGSKPVMDVLVTLCAQHHLVPSDHVIKLISTNQNHVRFKPNSMIGSLEFEKVVLQVKGSDDNKKKPHIPVATVRLLINYKKSHKAVARVNPAVPLAELMPAVCEKCEFHPDATVLLRTDQSEEPLDLTKSLNDYGIRELYAKQTKADPPSDPVSTNKGADEEQKTPVKEKNHREKANKGFFGLFIKSKKTSEQAVDDSAPASPELNGQCTDRVNGFNDHFLPTIPADMSKKRRAPLPPMVASQSVACDLQIKDFPESDPAGKQGPLSRISSTESSLKRTKRRAPPPPCDGSASTKSDNKVEEAEGQDRSSDKHRAVISDRCPEFDKVMSEFAELLQEWRQSTPAYANSSPSSNQPPESPLGLYTCLHTPEAELKALPGCQLLRKSSEREGLATFTVVPQRRQLSFELPFTSQTNQSPEHPEIHSTVRVETQIFTRTYESEHLIEAGENSQVGMCVKNGNLNEHQYIYPELKSWERSKEAKKRLKRGQNLERLDSRRSNLDLEERLDGRSLADWSAIDFHTSHVEQEEIEEPDLVESEEEKDWVEEFKERRMRFLGSHDDGIKKLDVWGRIQKEFTSTQVFWDEDSREHEEDKLEMQICNENLTNFHLRMDSKTKLAAYSYYGKPGAHSTLTNIQPNSSCAKNNFSFTSEAHLNTLSSKSHSGFESRPPIQLSLFAMAVFKKAKCFKPVFDPSPVRRRELPALTHSN